MDSNSLPSKKSLTREQFLKDEVLGLLKTDIPLLMGSWEVTIIKD